MQQLEEKDQEMNELETTLFKARKVPNPERRDRQVAMVKNKLNRALIRGCLQSKPEARPSIQEIIDKLEEPV